MTLRPRAGLSSLRPAADLYGDVLTAYVDVSRTTATGGQELDIRIGNLTRDLQDEGAAEEAVEAVVSRLQVPTGHGGDASRVVVAQGTEVVTDTVMGGAVPGRHHIGPIAHLLDLARGMADAVSYVVVLVDHAGADITVADTLGLVEQDLVSEGEHDEISKFGGGGWSHRRFQSRVEDSWDRNAETVARDIDTVVRQVGPDLVLVAGDHYGRSRVQESVGGHVTDLIEVLEHGSRADGAGDERMDEEIAAALQRCRSKRISDVLDQLGAADDRKAVGVGETLEALRRGEVETLILLDGALEDREAFVGPEPLLIGHTADELKAIGVDDPSSDRLDEILVRAAIGQDADLLALHAPVSALPDGVGAVLRFSTRPE